MVSKIDSLNKRFGKKKALSEVSLELDKHIYMGFLERMEPENQHC